MTNIRYWYDYEEKKPRVSCDIWSARPVYELRKAVRCLDIDVEICPLEKKNQGHGRRQSKHPWILTFEDKAGATTEITLKLLKFCERRKNWGTFHPDP